MKTLKNNQLAKELNNKVNNIAKRSDLENLFNSWVKSRQVGLDYENGRGYSQYSIFHFKINESVEELIKNMEKENDRRLFSRQPDGTMYLTDPSFTHSYATITPVEKNLYISTAWSGFEYGIFSSEAGTEVFFAGPLNSLLKQNLLPEMTYIPHTLEGKYNDMETFVSIEEYCLIREERHNGRYNDQDEYGHWINKSFNNEIPCLPTWVDGNIEMENVSQATYCLGDIISSLKV